MSAGGEGFTVDPDRLRAHAEEFAPLARRAERVVADLARTLDATRAPWGDDTVGQRFAQAHVPESERTRELLEGLPGTLERIGAAFADAASAYRTADEDAADTVTESGPAE